MADQGEPLETPIPLWDLRALCSARWCGGSWGPWFLSLAPCFSSNSPEADSDTG